MADPHRIIPIYSTSGRTAGFLAYPYIYNLEGEWIGWTSKNRQVFSVFGRYVGWLSPDFRILRRRAEDSDKAGQPPPHPPARLRPPAIVPLPPLMAEIKYETIDVLDESPELMPVFDPFALPEDPG